MNNEEFENLNDINKIEDAIIEHLSFAKRLEFKRDRLINQRKEEIEDLLTVAQVRKILNVSEQQVYKLIALKKLKAVKIEGSMRIKKVVLIEYIEKHSTFIQ
jgi:excisionase family DNA binding protein